jgi:hypothetical protein
MVSTAYLTLIHVTIYALVFMPSALRHLLEKSSDASASAALVCIALPNMTSGDVGGPIRCFHHFGFELQPCASSNICVGRCWSTMMVNHLPKQLVLP